MIQGKKNSLTGLDLAQGPLTCPLRPLKYASPCYWTYQALCMANAVLVSRPSWRLMFLAASITSREVV